MANQLVYNGRPMELETKRAVRAPIPKRNREFFVALTMHSILYPLHKNISYTRLLFIDKNLSSDSS